MSSSNKVKESFLDTMYIASDNRTDPPNAHFFS